MTEHAAWPTRTSKRNSLKFLRFWSSQSIMFGQRCIEHGKICINKLERRSIATENFFKESLGLTNHIRLQTIIKILKNCGINGNSIDSLEI